MSVDSKKLPQDLVQRYGNNASSNPYAGINARSREVEDAYTQSQKEAAARKMNGLAQPQKLTPEERKRARQDKINARNRANRAQRRAQSA